MPGASQEEEYRPPRGARNSWLVAPGPIAAGYCVFHQANFSIDPVWESCRSDLPTTHLWRPLK